MTQTRKQSAIFPDFPRDDKIVEDDGTLTPQYRLFFEQMVAALQVNFKPEGIVVPPKPTTEIDDLGDRNESIGNIIYDSTSNEFKGILLVTPGTPTTDPVTITKTFTLT